MDFHKKNRSSRLSSYHEYIFINEELDYIPAEGPGVARGKKKIWKKIKDLEKNWNFLAYVSPRLPMSVHKNFPQATHECPQKNQPIRSSQLAGYKEHIYECLVLFYRFVKHFFTLGKNLNFLFAVR